MQENDYHSNRRQTTNGYMPNTNQSNGQQGNYMPNTNQSNEQPNPSNNNNSEDNSSCTFVILIFLWFFGTMVFAIIFSAMNLGGLCLATFGPLFLVPGLKMFSKISDALIRTIPIIFILAGGGMVLGGIISQIGFEEELKEAFPTIIGIVFLGIGTYIILSPIISGIIKRKICTEKIDAVVSKINSSVSGSRRSGRKRGYSPVYQYEYNGATYTYSSDIYSNVCFRRLGNKLKIYVNPFNPKEVYIRSIGTIALAIIIGLGVLFFGLLILGLLKV